MKDLTKIEEILLIAIWRLEDEAYGVKIRQYVSNFLGKEFTYGNLYSALHQLSVKKYVDKSLGDPTPARRGRRKINYQVTARGREALRTAREMNKKLWTGLSDLAFDRKK